MKSDVHQCDQCIYSGKSKFRLKIHTDVHHRGIRYICNQCQHKSTTQINFYHHHKKKHDGVKPMKYERCIVEHSCEESNCKRKFEHVRSGKEIQKYVGLPLKSKKCHIKRMPKEVIQIIIIYIRGGNSIYISNVLS